MRNVCRFKGQFLVFASLVVAVLLLTACGGGSSSSSSTPSEGTTESSGASTENSSSSGGGASAEVKKAEELVAPYTGHSSPIPASVPLKEKPSSSDTWVFMQCAAPECAVVGEGVKEATAALGVNLKVIPTGASATSIEEAFESAAQLKPAAVLAVAIDPVLWPTARKKLQEEEVPVIAWTVPTNSGEGLYVFNGKKRFEDTGRLMAAWFVAKSNGEGRASFFWTPDYTVFKGEAEAFKEESENLCSACSVEVVASPSATIGSSLPGKVVSNLQQHPDTKWAVFAFGSMVAGVPQALAAAGVEAEIFSQAAGEPNWQYMKEGKQAFDLSGDIPVESWVAVDLAARVTTGQELPKTEVDGSTPQQFLSEEDITFDPAKGFEPFPEYRQTFEKLWEGK